MKFTALHAQLLKKGPKGLEKSPNAVVIKSKIRQPMAPQQRQNCKHIFSKLVREEYVLQLKKPQKNCISGYKRVLINSKMRYSSRVGELTETEVYKEFLLMTYLLYCVILLSIFQLLSGFLLARASLMVNVLSFIIRTYALKNEHIAAKYTSPILFFFAKNRLFCHFLLWCIKVTDKIFNQKSERIIDTVISTSKLIVYIGVIFRSALLLSIPLPYSGLILMLFGLNGLFRAIINLGILLTPEDSQKKAKFNIPHIIGSIIFGVTVGTFGVRALLDSLSDSLAKQMVELQRLHKESMQKDDIRHKEIREDQERRHRENYELKKKRLDQQERSLAAKNEK